ncbi:MAG TPA: DedA family protein [Psychromonas hadalis]|nr:DedA family protein [Psychromonas hadalis]
MSSELFALFFSAFISSTLFPGGSEVLFAYLLNQQPEHVFLFFIFVTAGNSLGAIVTYFMGYYLSWKRLETIKKHPGVWQWANKHGAWALLFSWLPIIGDLLPLMAGWLKINIYLSMLMIIIGKALRYSLIIYLFL